MVIASDMLWYSAFLQRNRDQFINDAAPGFWSAYRYSFLGARTYGTSPIYPTSLRVYISRPSRGAGCVLENEDSAPSRVNREGRYILEAI